MGVITSLIAAVIPARSAAGVDPVKALQKGRYQSMSEGENRARRRWALACAVASVATLTLNRNSIVFYGGYLLAVLAAVLLSPALAHWLAQMLRPAFSWIHPVEGTLAADSLIQAPRRTSGTVAALMLSLALVISLGGLARASYDSISNWMSIALNPDLFVTTAESVTSRSFVFPAALGDGLRKIGGVGDVQLVRSVRVVVKGAPIMVVAVDIDVAREARETSRVGGRYRRNVSQRSGRTGRDCFGKFRASPWLDVRRNARNRHAHRSPADCPSSASCAIFPISRAAC